MGRPAEVPIAIGTAKATIPGIATNAAIAQISIRLLTVKLRGRTEAPDQAPRAHNLSRARGADIQAVHGPLQRLLDAGINANHLDISNRTPFPESELLPDKEPSQDDIRREKFNGSRNRLTGIHRTRL